MKTRSTKNKELLRKINLLRRANFSSLDNGCDLSMEKLRYKLTEIRLAKFRKPSFLKIV